MYGTATQNRTLKMKLYLFSKEEGIPHLILSLAKPKSLSSWSTRGYVHFSLSNRRMFE